MERVILSLGFAVLASSLSAAASYSVTPYVQRPATNAMTVLFFTTESCAATVRCWRTDRKGVTNELATTCVDVSSKLGKNALNNSDTLTYPAQYRHRVRFEGLRPLTDYRYEVTLPGGETYRNAFAPCRDGIRRSASSATATARRRRTDPRRRGATTASRMRMAPSTGRTVASPRSRSTSPTSSTARTASPTRSPMARTGRRRAT